jgi:hypothetical protein
MKNNFLKKISLLLLVVFVSIFFAQYNLYAQKQKNIIAGYIPINGFVPNKETAIKIALAVWLPIYGNVIYREKPYTAELKGEVWVVEGSLKKGEVGGVAQIVIQKKDGKIIRVYHGK